MADSIKHKTIRALSWSFLEAVGQRGVQFVIGIVLARLLFPEQFGLIGMLTIFMAVAQIIPRQRVRGRPDSEARCHANRHLFDFLFQHLRRAGGGGSVVLDRSLDCCFL